MSFFYEFKSHPFSLWGQDPGLTLRSGGGGLGELVL